MIHRGQLWGTWNISAMPWKTSLENSRSDNLPLQIQKNHCWNSLGLGISLPPPPSARNRGRMLSCG
jgi:hypothetical protein